MLLKARANGKKKNNLQLLWRFHVFIKISCFIRRPRLLEAEALFHVHVSCVSPAEMEVDLRVIQGSITPSLGPSAVR